MTRSFPIGLASASKDEKLAATKAARQHERECELALAEAIRSNDASTTWPYGLTPRPDLEDERKRFTRELESRVQARQEFWDGAPPRVKLFGEALAGEVLAVVCLAIDREARRLDTERGVRVLETTHDAENIRHKKDREDKAYAQELARQKWKAQPDMSIPYLSIPEVVDTIREVFEQEGKLKLDGKPYLASTLRRWIANLAPPPVRKPGRRKSN